MLAAVAGGRRGACQGTPALARMTTDPNMTAFDFLDTTRDEPGPAIKGAVCKDPCATLSALAKAQRRFVSTPLKNKMLRRAIGFSADSAAAKLRKAGLLAARVAAELVAPVAKEGRRQRRDNDGNAAGGKKEMEEAEETRDSPSAAPSPVSADGDADDPDGLGAFADATAGAHADLLVAFDRETRAQASLRLGLGALAQDAAAIKARTLARDAPGGVLATLRASLAQAETALNGLATDV